MLRSVKQRYRRPLKVHDCNMSTACTFLVFRMYQQVLACKRGAEFIVLGPSRCLCNLPKDQRLPVNDHWQMLWRAGRWCRLLFLCPRAGST